MPLHQRHRSVTTSIAILALLVGCLAGCDQKKLIEKLTPPEDDAFAREFIFNVTRGGELDAAYARLDPSLQNVTGRTGLESLENLFGRGVVRRVDTIGVFVRTSTGTEGTRTTTELSYQLEMTTGWFAGSVTTIRSGEEHRILNANFDAIAGDLEAMNRFGAVRKTPFRLGFLAICIAVPLFCVVTMVVCFRSKVPRKIVWMIAIALPVIRVSLDWTTGEVHTNLLSFVFLGSLFHHAGTYTPWVFSFALPIGAIVFWANRRELSTNTPPPPPPPPPST